MKLWKISSENILLRLLKLDMAVKLIKKEMIEIVHMLYDCTTKEILSEYSSMKKDGLVYSVSGLNGWVGLYE